MTGKNNSSPKNRLLRLLQREMRRRVTIHPLPFSAFDAVRASKEQLAAFGLPPRPDATINPQLHAFWEQMFAQPLHFIRPNLEAVAQMRHLLREGSAGRGSGAIAFTPSRWGTSRNWSGAVIAARDGMVFHTIAGSWRVPAPQAPAGASATHPPPGGAWQCSVWIGFDGFRLWSVSLPQMGTVSEIDAKGGVLQPGTYAFCQWWVRGKSYGEIRIGNMPVAPCDEILCMLTALSPTDVNFSMTNRTQGQNVSLSWAAGEVETDPARQDRSDAPLEGRTAVWCVERPLTLPQGAEAPDFYILPEIGSARFVTALAEMRDPSNPAASSVPRDLTAARFLRMVGSKEEAPPRSTILTSPDAPAGGGGAFSVHQR